MQTFLPDPSFVRSAQTLDRQRLGKQRIECKQILGALLGLKQGWRNHPAVKMWRGHEEALVLYAIAVCEEWRSRGYQDAQLPWFQERLAELRAARKQEPTDPKWITPAFCRSHQSNLVRKFPEHYRKFWPDVPNNLEYEWPV